MAEEQVDALLLTTRFDESGLDSSARDMLDGLRDFVGDVNRVQDGVRPFQLPIDTTSLGLFRESVRAAAGDATVARELFAGFAAQAEEELRAFGVTGSQVATIISRLWAELQRTAAEADQTRAPIAALTDGLQRVRGILAAPLPPLLLTGGEQVRREVEIAQTALRQLQATALEVNRTQRQLAAPPQRLLLTSGTPTSPVIPRDLQTLQAQYARLRAEAVVTTEAGRRMTEMFNQSGPAAQRAGEGARKMAEGIRLAGTTNREAEAAFLASGRGLDKVRGGMIALANSTTGVPPAVSSVISGLLLMGPGSPAVLGVAAAAAVIGAAYTVITAGARRAKEEQDDLINSLRSRVQAGFSDESSQRAAVRFRLEELRIRQQQIAVLQQQARAELDIGRAISLRVAQRAAEREAQGLTRDLAVDEARAAREQGEAIAAARTEAARQGAADELAFARQVLGQEETLLREALAGQQITREEFARRRLELARRTAAAEISATRVDLAAANVVPVGETGAQRTAREAQITHLESLIALRNLVLAQQGRQIAQEIQLGRLADLQQSQAPITPAEGLQRIVRLKPEIDQAEVDAIIARTVAAADAASLDARLVTELDRARAAGIALEEVLRGVDLALADVGNANITGPRADLEQMIDAVADLNRGLDSMVRGALDIGLIGDEAARAIGQVQNLADSIAAVAANASAGNILGVIGSGLTLLGGLFGGGPSPAEIALRENTEAIRQNTIRRTEGFEGVGGASDVANIIRQVLGTDRGAALASQTQAPVGGREIRAELVAMIGDLGLSFEQLQRVAQDFGIEILADGRLVGSALAQLEEEIRAVVAASLRLGRTFDEQAANQALRSRLAGEEQNAATAFRDQINAAAAVGASAVTEAFGNFEALSQDDLRAAALNFLNRLDAGQLDPSQLGGLTREDLVGIVTGAADAIDEMGESARRAALEMANIPAGFRQARLAAEAQIAGLGPSPALTVTPNIFPTNRPGDGASLPDLVNAVKQARGITIETLIVQGANTDNAEQLLDKLVEAAERRSASGDVNTFTVRRG
jgi:hypothetical protein